MIDLMRLREYSIYENSKENKAKFVEMELK